ncbi:hypothetical protein LEP1GSC126_0041 [Leptospira kirschneri str. 200801774]|uniref:DUF4376 domain-containing protein n=1 Tax=Leptospira kirschneri TaxID=29507 RepID=UPI0002BF06DE|nr:hypothetical protein [Leptospira kirschneri]EMO78545.1 hypothetical protein LEP1GSC126_0041 [Leptospira kirschneri str. 200801774]
MNYILEKSNKKIIWINTDPDRLDGPTAWMYFDPSKHEAVYSSNYNPQVGDVFRANVEDGVAKEFEHKKVYNKISIAERTLFQWEDVMDPETETEDEPLRDINGVFLPYQIHTESGWILDFVRIQSEGISRVNSLASWWICDGFSSHALGERHYYNSDRDDQLNLLGLAALGTGELLKCALDPVTKKEYVLHTPEQLKKVLTDGADRKKFLLRKAAELKSQILNATTIEELNAIDIDSGWEEG